MDRLQLAATGFLLGDVPPGLSGFILAGIVTAAVSSLSSSLQRIGVLVGERPLRAYCRTSEEGRSGAPRLSAPHLILGFWGVVFIGFTSLFQDSDTPVIELGLSIASFTYGSLLGVFLLGLWHERSRESDAIIAFAVAIGAMVLVIFGVWHSPAEGGFVLNPADAYATDASLKGIGGAWHTAIGTVINLVIGSLLALRHERSMAPQVRSEEAT